MPDPSGRAPPPLGETVAVSEPTGAAPPPASEPPARAAGAPDAPAPAQGGTERAPARKRGRETAIDMVRTLAVIAVPVLLLVLVVARQPSPDPVRLVDWAPVSLTAAEQAAYPVVAPAGLPAEWRATSARFEPVPRQRGATLWHLGLLTPADDYAGLEQSDADPTGVVEDFTFEGTPAGTVDLGGATWSRYTAGTNGYRSLVRTWGTSTVVVNGSAEWAELDQLAGSLRVVPVPGPSPSGPAPSGGVG